MKIGQIFDFRQKSQEYAILMGFWLIVKGNHYDNMHRKFQEHSTNIFVLGVKNKYCNVATPPRLPLTLTAYPTPTQG